MEYNCIICGSVKNKYLFSRNDGSYFKQDIYRCYGCGLIFARPLPDEGLLKKHYNAHFFTEKFDYVESGKIWRDFYERNLRYIERSRKPGSLLEVGCGLGHFLNAAKNRGWEVFGVELSEFACRYAKDNFGLNLYNGPLLNAGFAENKFDAVVLWATLEHLRDPLNELKQIYNLMAPAGLLALSVPNHNSIFNRLYGLKHTDMQHFEHLYHFPLCTLKMMLAKAGFHNLRRMVIFGGSPRASMADDLMQFIGRKLNLGSETRILAFKGGKI